MIAAPLPKPKRSWKKPAPPLSRWPAGQDRRRCLTLDDKDSVTIAELREGFESWFPNYMSGEEIPVTN